MKELVVREILIEPNKTDFMQVGYQIANAAEGLFEEALYQSVLKSLFAAETLAKIRARIEKLPDRVGEQYKRVISFIKEFYTQVPSFQSGELGEILCRDLFVQMEGKQVYIMNDWGLRDNSKMPKRGVDVIAFRLNAENGRGLVYATEVKTAVNRRNLEKALDGDGGILDWLNNKLTAGVFAREINRILSYLPEDHSDRASISDFIELFDSDPGRIVRTSFIVVPPGILEQGDIDAFIALADSGHSVCLYVFTSRSFNKIKDSIFERFELHDEGSTL